ncbi:peptidoglycan-binding protein, partial [Escherichia coli]|nr:peptidoglycan-binding protein [Escherichia coli]EFI3591468.1 peptidoglycan-binding protein [Escherichia coli]EFI5665693.1 peptidoglycan-binding protein [Escherichia coli]EGC2551739.1 peptidoglycan-binding protein [Escherichia coli]EGO6619791.1 peptidoglycan-binding protein [Escherichia coli]
MENLKLYLAFERALNFILRPDIEGVYVNDPTDRGGETRYGISDRRDGVIDGKTDVNGDGKPDTRIKDFTREQVAQIYWRDYWLPAGCDQWPDRVALFVFDAAVQHGVKKAIK